ncbi:MAG: transcriptional repressor [Oscillospiraceae bacterium]
MITMKYSKQRELIEQTVKTNKIHPTADDIYSILKPEYPHLSLGTVYRNLNTLVEIGSIHKLSIPNASDRFDGQLHQHYHVICNVCRKIFDVELSFCDKLDEIIKEKTGVCATSHQLIINGICENCS